MKEHTPAPWQISTQFLFGLALTVLFFYMMAPFIVAILLGAVIAIIAYPAFAALRRKMPSILAALITSTTIAIGLLLPLFFVLYSVSFKILGLFAKLRIPRTGNPTFSSLVQHPVVAKVISVISRFMPVNADWFRDQSLDVLQSIIEKLSGVIASFFAGMPSLILNFFVVIVSLFFLMTDGDRFLKFLSHLSPLSPERSNVLYETFERSCRGVVLGLFLSAIVQGVLMSFLFIVTGIPNALLVGVVTVVMGMVPVVGSAPIWIGATIYLFAMGSIGFGVVMLVGGILIAVSDNIVRPWVLKGQSEMHPLLALVSVFGAVNLLGPTGIFLGPIIAAVFVSFLKILSLELRREKIATG